MHPFIYAAVCPFIQLCVCLSINWCSLSLAICLHTYILHMFDCAVWPELVHDHLLIQVQRVICKHVLKISQLLKIETIGVASGIIWM